MRAFKTYERFPHVHGDTYTKWCAAMLWDDIAERRRPLSPWAQSRAKGHGPPANRSECPGPSPLAAK
jgi:hypothetical protein